MRFLSFFLILILFFSCSYFSTDKKISIQPKDTIINFSKVDVSPSFKVCDKLLDEAKTNCFRVNMQQQMTKNLKKFSIATQKPLNEEVRVVLQISKNGKVSLHKINSSEIVKSGIPNFDSLIQASVDDLPILKPATKRGIPVSTQYTLPIKIQSKQ